MSTHMQVHTDMDAKKMPQVKQLIYMMKSSIYSLLLFAYLHISVSYLRSLCVVGAYPFILWWLVTRLTIAAHCSQAQRHIFRLGQNEAPKEN